jgi:hypothetical protein
MSLQKLATNQQIISRAWFQVVAGQPPAELRCCNQTGANLLMQDVTLQNQREKEKSFGVL